MVCGYSFVGSVYPDYPSAGRENIAHAFPATNMRLPP